MASRMRRDRQPVNIWPGFVDAIATLLIIIIFLLMVFFLAQHFLSQILTGRNEALVRLNRQVAELTDMLSLERGANADLRVSLSQLSAELQSSITTRDRLQSQLSELMPERDVLSTMLADSKASAERLRKQLAELRARYDAAVSATNKTAQEIDDAERRADTVGRELEDAYKLIDADKEKITAQLREIESLRRDLAALRTVRAALEKRVADMAGRLEGETAARTALRDRTRELEARLASAEERTVLAQRQIADKDTALARERNIASKAQAQLQVLNIQLVALRRQLARLEAALQVSEARTKEQDVQIVDLGRRLNLALAAKVEELSRFRSEFFGRLREALGDREDIQIVGDRFVFQSEVLFPSGSDHLETAGKVQIAKLAQTLREISPTIPKNLNWVLRVDGHTDKIPISTPQFPSNWELSTARAVSVVKFLISLGIPPARLAATGFGEYQPLDPGDNEVAYRRNRRIEFKLTER
jgi:chemotaxis protein MotB